LTRDGPHDEVEALAWARNGAAFAGFPTTVVDISIANVDRRHGVPSYSLDVL
jgi:hypothetical protein